MMSCLLRRAVFAVSFACGCGTALAQDAAPAAPAAPAPAPAAQGSFDPGMIPAPHLLMPKGEAKAMVVLLSDAAGWSAKEDNLAASLSEAGSFVIGIDLPTYLASLEKDESDDCIYTVSDIESLSQQMQRSIGGSIYHLPIVAGVGSGGAMALAIAAQTPDATVDHTIAVDPAAGIGLKKGLCTPATREVKGDVAVYGLTDGTLPAPISVELTAAAPADGKAHVDALVAAHSDIEVEDSDEDDAYAALSAKIDDIVATPAEDELGLPLDVLETPATRGVMAVIYSGDGGWRDLDKEIGDAFQAKGVPTIGVDSLRYFWSERTPKQTAEDLSRIIDLYSKRWGVKEVILVGFSFGADILPTTYNLLAPADKARVKEISLLALSESATWEISVSGWLGVGDDENKDNPQQMKSIDPKLVQCIYGTDDEDQVCSELKDLGIELVAVDGGHHFDGDYVALADKILDGLKQRVDAAAATPKP